MENLIISSCFLRMLSINYDFAGEPHPQNCKTVDRSQILLQTALQSACMKLNCVHDLSSQAIVPVLLSLFGLHYPSSGAATLKIRDISGKQHYPGGTRDRASKSGTVPGRLAPMLFRLLHVHVATSLDITKLFYLLQLALHQLLVAARVRKELQTSIVSAAISLYGLQLLTNINPLIPCFLKMNICIFSLKSI